MAENLETEIRKALDAQAHEVEVPSDLASRTLEHANRLGRASLRSRMRSRRDARRMRMPVAGYPRWIYVGAAAATAVLLFVVGLAVTSPRRAVETAGSPNTRIERRPQPGEDQVIMDLPALTTVDEHAGGDASR